MNLEAMRKNLGFTQKQMGEALEVSTVTWGRYETGGTVSSAVVAKKVKVLESMMSKNLDIMAQLAATGGPAAIAAILTMAKMEENDASIFTVVLSKPFQAIVAMYDEM